MFHDTRDSISAIVFVTLYRRSCYHLEKIERSSPRESGLSKIGEGILEQIHLDLLLQILACPDVLQTFYQRMLYGFCDYFVYPF